MRLRLALCCAALAAASHAPATARAQTLHFDAGFDRSVTSVEPLSSPTGFRLAFAADELAGRFGVLIVYRRLWEPAVRRDQLCNAFFCEPGPFDVSWAFSVIGAGLTMGVHPFDGSDLLFALNASLYRQIETVRPIGGDGGTSNDDVGPNPGLGASVEFRLPAVVATLRPMIFARYDFIAPHLCLADASCWGSRHVGSLGAGLAWTIR